MTTPKTDALQAARDLTAGMAQFRTDIETLKSSDRRRRQALRVLGISVAFDIALSLGLGWVAWQSNEAATKATRATSTASLARNNTKAACVALNESSEKQKSLWSQTIALPPPSNETAAEKARRIESTRTFVAILDETFAPVECDR